VAIRLSRSRRGGASWVHSQEDCFLAEAEGRCPREALGRPCSCCCSHFGVIELTVDKFAGQPQVATAGSLERMSNREVNSPDFLAGARTSQAHVMEPPSAPKGRSGTRGCSRSLIQHQSTTNFELGGFCHEHFTFLGFGRLPEEDTTADPILATEQHIRQRGPLPPAKPTIWV
jgi:hypothetical protein